MHRWCLLAVEHTFQVADVVHADVCAFHLHDHLLGLAALIVREVDIAGSHTQRVPDCGLS